MRLKLALTSVFKELVSLEKDGDRLNTSLQSNQTFAPHTQGSTVIKNKK